MAELLKGSGDGSLHMIPARLYAQVRVVVASESCTAAQASEPRRSSPLSSTTVGDPLPREHHSDYLL